jgi:hypothetical protein
LRTDLIWDDVPACALPLRSRFDLPAGSIVYVDVATSRGARCTIDFEIHRDGAWLLWRMWQPSLHDTRASWFARPPDDATAGRLTARGAYETISARVES